MRGVKHEVVRFPCIPERVSTHIRSRKTPKASSSKYQETGYISMRGRGLHRKRDVFAEPEGPLHLAHVRHDCMVAGQACRPADLCHEPTAVPSPSHRR